MIEKHIQLLKNHINKLEDSTFDLKAWKSSAIIILDRISTDNFQSINAIENIVFNSGGINNARWNNLESCKAQGKAILETVITELETFGERERKKTEPNGININLTQNQTVNISFLISALEDELTVSQMKEVNEIMQNDEPKIEKKKRIIEKIKSFGSDVATNILASILTNPSIWQ